MLTTLVKSIAVAVAVLAANHALAGICAYRPSQLIGGTTTGVIAGGAGTAAAAGAVLKAGGIYAITNATTGAAMLGSTAAGASAAGTTGILAGSAGLIGTAGAVLTSPLLIVPAAITAVGVGALEGGCYFSGK